jgi:hypothetical protein
MSGTLVLRPAIGLRFTDAADGTPVVDGLSVRAGRARFVRPGSEVGAFSLSRAPAELATVSDMTGRFLGLRVALTQPGLNDPISLPSAPSRSVPPGFAAIRAQLSDASTHLPASWAVLELTCAGTTVSAIADVQGSALGLLPWPAPATALEQQPLLDQQWPVSVVARWERTGPGAPMPEQSALRAQPVVRALASAGHDDALGDQTLTYGRELVLRTGTRSDLLLAPTP